jgi:hypothetical protein
LRTNPARRSFQEGLAKEVKDGWHLTRLIHLVVADMAKGAPGGALSFLRAGVVALEKRENPVREPLIRTPASGARAEVGFSFGKNLAWHRFSSHSCSASPSCAAASSIPSSHAAVYVERVKLTVE